MNSKVGRSGGGFGRYADAHCDSGAGRSRRMLGTPPARRRGSVANPWGNRSRVCAVCRSRRRSAQPRGTTDLRHHPAVRGQGRVPVRRQLSRPASALKKGKLERQEYIEIDADNPLESADIVLVRAGSASGWKHVAMVWEAPTGDDLVSIDGNQGNPCIRKRTRSMSATVNNGKDYALVFLHVHI